MDKLSGMGIDMIDKDGNAIVFKTVAPPNQGSKNQSEMYKFLINLYSPSLTLACINHPKKKEE